MNRTIRADEVRTGDTIMPPSTGEQRLVLQATTRRDTTTFRYTAGVAHMPPGTLVRVHRPNRVEDNNSVNHVPQVIFSSKGN